MTSLPAQLELLTTHGNEFLFSNHYLGKRLPTRREWQEIEVDLVFEKLQALWADLDPKGLNEAQTEDWWIKPVLKALGHYYSVQVSINTPRNVRQPDYVLARTEEASRELRGVLEEAELTDALAVADAKKWGRNLDVRGTDDSKISDVPSLQIDFYLRYSGIGWGVLTNGEQWRLYHRETSHKLEVFYEVNLPALLEQDDKEAFKYFYLFFRREAFVGKPSFLELVLEESKAYEHGVSEDLQTQVYDALMSVSRGFFELGSNELEPDDETLKAVHDNSLIVLYRLLFLLFAESRGLLPMDNRVYREDYSLEQLKRAVQRRGGGTVGIAGGTKLWQALTDLWRFVDKGEETLEVPPYNGGLFNPDKHPFLEKYRVGDRHLAEAIDLLARAVDKETGEREFVDYRDLEVRHLGSIYEGLLEYKLAYTPEALRVDKDSGTYVPVEAGEDAEVAAGQVYLVTDDGERKSTGSYYTPDYIVQYIVERTVGPVLEDLREEHTNAEGELGDRKELAEKVLRVNVLDPAMGSGHFLVDVTDYIARFLVEVSPDKEGDDAETELAYWRRRVAQACVYGVDLNPLAVELAKLSLWLRTVAKDKPLSFLDHHLRCGNSLVGAHVEDLPLETERTDYQRRKERKARKAGQASLMETATFQEAMSSARGLMDRIEAIAGDELEQVQEAADLYEELVEKYTKAPKMVADVVLAEEFGFDLRSFFEEDLAKVKGTNVSEKNVLDAFWERVREGTWVEVPKYRQIVEEAKEISEALRFFHWELEFPEVFFAKEGELAGEQAGFDAVVGNPPYVRMERFKALKDYLREEYEVYDTRTDLYVYFIEKSLEICRERGLYGVIVSNKWLRADYGTGVREMLLRKTTLRELIDFRDLPVFGAVTYPLILVVSEGKEANSDPKALLPDTLEGLNLTVKMNEEGEAFEQDTLSSTAWNISGVKVRKVLSKLRSVGQPLEEYIGGEPLMGIKTGLNEAFVIDKETRDTLVAECPKSEEILLPLCVGREVRRFHLEWSGDFLIYTPHGIDIEQYPAVKEHLSPFKERLEGRATEQEWYELQQPQQAYEEFLRGVKIINPDLAERARFYLDTEGFVTTNTAYFLPTDDAFLLGVLNSKVSTFFLSEVASTYRGGYIRLFGQYLKQLPVPKKRAGGALSNELRDKVQEKTCEESSTLGEAISALGATLQELFRRAQKLQRALDPFKYLDRGTPAAKLREELREEIKFAEQVYDLGRVHHDVDGVALNRQPGGWHLQVLLKMRDAETEWKEWIKDGHEIVREWVTVYQFDAIDERKAVYFQKAFEVLGEFEHTGSFPGGRTRTTKKKLELTKIPRFDEEVDLDALVELTNELTSVEAEIEEADEMIDDLVYQLYDLTSEEIAIVERAQAQWN